MFENMFHILTTKEISKTLIHFKVRKKVKEFTIQNTQSQAKIIARYPHMTAFRTTINVSTPHSDIDL